MPNTSYRVVGITEHEIKIGYQSAIVTIKPSANKTALQQPPITNIKPTATLASQQTNYRKPGIENSQKDKNNVVNPAITVQKNRITMTGIAHRSVYGVKNNDQVIAIEKQRVHNVAQIKSTINLMNKSVARVSVLRNGRIISLLLPTQFISSMLTFHN